MKRTLTALRLGPASLILFASLALAGCSGDPPSDDDASIPSDTPPDESTPTPTTFPGTPTPTPSSPTPTPGTTPTSPTPGDTSVPGTPDIDLSSSAIDFGDVTVGDSAQATVTVSNLGDATLTLSVDVANDAGGDFSLAVLGQVIPSSIESGGSAQLTIEFAPQAEGASTGTLTFTSDDPDEATVTVSLEGNGIPVVIDDADGDGYTLDGDETHDPDCDDEDASVYPGAAETCDQKDNDCDSSIDEDGATTFYPDTDHDGYGAPGDTLVTCDAPDGYAPTFDDCDDADASIYPGAPEQCDGTDNDCDSSIDEDVQSTFYQDADLDGHGDASISEQACTAGDGWAAVADDCDDADPARYPGNPETCDQVDNDCDDQVDEDLPLDTWYADVDQDGYGDPNAPIDACGQTAGTSATSDDCDDSSSIVYPGALEACDTVDNDCDDQVDEDGSSTFYTDQDSDGYGDSGTAQVTCAPASNQVSQGGDCNDGNAAVSPGALETCDAQDNDCDAQIDEGVTSTFYADTDGDGYGNPGAVATGCSAPPDYVADSSDCDDLSASIHPGALEACNGKDDDCDGTADEGVTSTFYADVDGDGHGDSSASTKACAAPSGYVASSDDCNDRDAAVYPGNTEVCDAKDNDCDATVDEGVKNTYYEDKDGDGAGNPSVSVQACSAPAGYVSSSNDCNDADATVYIGAKETCDLKDNDCDKLIDEEGATLFYRDFDKDGYGDDTVTQLSCTAPAGYVANADDCNDKDASIHPGAAEACNGKDDDCDGAVDDGVLKTWYLDADKDGYGTSSSSLQGCSAPSSSYVENSGDCDDLNASVYPGATEACNAKDDDCDGSIDEGVKSTFYADADKDTYGNPASSQQACAAPTGYVANNTDCDDTKSTTYPGARELCDGADNDCDSIVDEDAKTTFYLDNDKDGYGISSATVQACTAPTGYAAVAGDCNDADSAINPGATESCDSKDNDCDGGVDEEVKKTFYYDADLDTYGDPNSGLQACSAPSSRYVSNGLDCNDANAKVYPGATETCNSVDDDCDGSVDEDGDKTFYKDADGDSYGNANATTKACTAPTGYVSRAGDCDDTNARIYPGATEVRGDGVDQDCDGKDLPHLDLNLDGYPDLVVANHYSSTTGYPTDSYIYWGSNKGPSSSNRTALPTLGAHAICVADFNKDGYQDVVFANYYTGSSYNTNSYVYWGKSGGPTSSSKTDLPTRGATDCSVGDVNGDGWLDIGFAGYYDNSGAYNSTTYLYYGSSSGFSASSVFSVASFGNYALHIADLNGDGKDELIQSNHYASSGGYVQTSYVYWGASGGLSSSNRTGFPTTGCWHKAVVNDLNGDGYKDLFFTAYYNNSSYDVNSTIYWGSSAGFSTSNKTDLPTTGSAQGWAGDLDGDGYKDLVIAGHYNGSTGYTTNASVYWGSSRGYSTSNRTLLPTYMTHYFQVEDLNLDGYEDLIIPFHYNGSTYVFNSYIYMGSPTGFSTSNRYSLATNGSIDAAVKDMDLDGYTDVFIPGYYNSSSYNTESYLYWGSNKGYASDIKVTLPAAGTYRTLVVGDPD